MLFLPLTVVRMDSTDLYSNIESALHSHDGSRLVVVQYIYIFFHGWTCAFVGDFSVYEGIGLEYFLLLP